MSIRMISLALASVAAAATWQAAPAAMAQSTSSVDEITVRGVTVGDEVKREKVSFGDLDLTQENGAKMLIGRLQVAAKAVCSPEPSIGDLKMQTQYKNCVHKAVSDAVSDVGNSRVAALYADTGA